MKTTAMMTSERIQDKSHIVSESLRWYSVSTYARGVDIAYIGCWRGPVLATVYCNRVQYTVYMLGFVEFSKFHKAMPPLLGLA